MNGIFESVKAAAANIPDSGEQGNYSSDMFQKDFPQFLQIKSQEMLVPDHMLKLFVKNANSSVLPSKWGEMWQYAAGLYVAHFCAMYLKTYSTGSLNEQQAAANGQQMGVIKSAQMGDTTISYDNSAITAGTVKWGAWNATQYGQQLVSMARLVGMGGIYVI